jgi:signal transduction histidine kinase
MKNAAQVITFLGKPITSILADGKINTRPHFRCILTPVILSGLLVCLHLNFFKDAHSIPYVFLFCIVVLSSMYAGSRGTLFASFITFITVNLYHIWGIHADIMMTFLYLISCLLLSVLLYFMFQQQKAQELLLKHTIESNAELRRLEKSHEDFVNMATHELKLPVTVLKAYIQMLFLKADRHCTMDKYLDVTDKMDGQLDKLLNVISDLQDATKITADSLSCLMHDFNINESLVNCIEDALMANPQLEIEYNLIYPAPILKGDKDRIEQIINNLIANALKYSGAEKRLRVCCKNVGDTVRIAVIDNGFGIPLEKQPYIFERFYRVGSPQVKRMPGLGLGLFICKEIIRQHNGEIGVVSKEGLGSEFWFSLKKSEKYSI